MGLEPARYDEFATLEGTDSDTLRDGNGEEVRSDVDTKSLNAFDK